MDKCIWHVFISGPGGEGGKGSWSTFINRMSYNLGTPKIYTTTGLGPRNNREMAGVDNLVVYMQTAVKYKTFYIHHPGGAKRPRGGVNTNCCILHQFAYTPPNGPHQPFPCSSRPKPGGGLYFWGPNNVWESFRSC